VNLRKKDRLLTAVRTVLGLFEYAVMAQGLKGACAFFQKMVNEVYAGLRFTGENEFEKVCAVMAECLDDLAEGSDSAAEHLVDLTGGAGDDSRRWTEAEACEVSVWKSVGGDSWSSRVSWSGMTVGRPYGGICEF
jgi:hypothetical protein